MSALEVTVLPCPFCGGQAKLVSGTISTVQCQNDQCIIGDPAPFNDFSHRADAITAWNTRTQPAPDDSGLREVLRLAIKPLERMLEGDLAGGCKFTDGRPDRSTLDPDFEADVIACEAALAAARLALSTAAGEDRS